MKEKTLNLDEVLGILKKRKSEFEAAYGVTAIGLFGSLARGEATLDSDVDRGSGSGHANQLTLNDYYLKKAPVTSLIHRFYP